MKAAPEAVQRWSTQDVPTPERLDVYAETLTRAVDPMHVTSSSPAAFHAQVASTQLGAATLINAVGGRHRCVRDEHDIATGGERSLHLIINTAAPWRLTQRQEMCLRAGDAVILDSQLPHDIELDEFAIIHLRLPQMWLRRWLPTPSVLAGRVVPRDAVWGAALTAFVSQLSPQRVIDGAVPASVFADHVGVLLALMAAELDPHGKPRVPHATPLRDRIVECLQQRCTEVSLSTTDVARALDISLRTLHRCLAADGRTFGTTLTGTRADLGLRLLESPLYNRVSTAEIGRRAGFSDASHFARVIHQHFGQTPSQLRRGSRRHGQVAAADEPCGASGA